MTKADITWAPSCETFELQFDVMMMEIKNELYNCSTRATLLVVLGVR